MEYSKVCPWWMGYMLLVPIRKFSHNPQKILSPYLKPGMRVIDFGCAMGYFSLPMAQMVGSSGKVYCFDIQQKMLDKLKCRAEKAGVREIIEPKLIAGNESDFEGMEQSADFALLFAVAHEVPDRKKLFADLYRMLKPQSFLYFAEPPGHVKKEEFQQSVSLAEQAGFNVLGPANVSKTHSVILQKL
ncbi:MAG: hypothetical protein A2W90_24360 [Bacteroidetes bacterium GWF2_42_66]|nr:MAG: hypothetical protein A2W92_09025 [Bacteroidetes bacterium GWA2_42_15]OFX98005.1 MAG: hypothetical protein A2W89_07740 [Bacteroidetes bacterium GWE2_42_39]OFY45857.1 MAG: hypothetical protein A2W90_24360 [Bacteroidetes bacterium GWF2_42_66]